MKALQDRGRLLADQAVARRSASIAALCEAELDEVEVERSEADIAINGKQLLRGWLENAELRSLRGRS